MVLFVVVFRGLAKRAGKIGDNRCVFFSASGNDELPAAGAGYFDLYVDPLLRQAAGHAVGPFDDASPGPSKNSSGTEGEKFFFIVKPVGVYVINGFSAAILLHEHERGADHCAAIDSQGLGHGLHQPGLAGTNVPYKATTDPSGKTCASAAPSRAVQFSSSAMKVK